MSAGAPIDFAAQQMSEQLAQHDIDIAIDLHDGTATGQAWGSDLTYGYVKINALYTT